MTDPLLGHRFPAICDPNALPSRVLVLAAHPDDEVIGIGGLLAFHGQRGDRVRVVHATRGDAGDPGARHQEIAKLREDELRRALAELGLAPGENLGYGDGALAQHLDPLTRDLRTLFEEDAPELLYVFHAGEYHSDHRSLAQAAFDARMALPEACRILLFGVNQVVPFGDLYEYSARVESKRRALACFESQLAYLDFASKVMHRDQAATVNVELPEITHAELILETCRSGWQDHVESSRRALLAADPSARGEA
ncbi:MAG: hypothetical protein CSA62_12045 [Planctomycetota bacterium]|nr:MAG: hypothetical protein CSA62_12045 [Planctomycetota bacterium]